MAELNQYRCMVVLILFFVLNIMNLHHIVMRWFVNENYRYKVFRSKLAPSSARVKLITSHFGVYTRKPTLRSLDDFGNLLYCRCIPQLVDVYKILIFFFFQSYIDSSHIFCLNKIFRLKKSNRKCKEIILNFFCIVFKIRAELKVFF